MKGMKEVKCSVITVDGCYHDVVIYKFDGITTEDILEQLHCLGIYRVTGIIEY